MNTRPTLHLLATLTLSVLLAPGLAAAQDFDFSADDAKKTTASAGASDGGAPDGGEASITWGDKVNKREGTAGVVYRRLIKYHVFTQFYSLEKSDTRIVLVWRSRRTGQDTAQLLYEGRRYARGADYKFSVLGSTLLIKYPCPLKRGDKETVCTEHWKWDGRQREFYMAKRHSSNPTERSVESILALISNGNRKRALKAIELYSAAQKKKGETVKTDRFFVAFFLRMHSDFKALAKQKKHDRAVALLKDFLKNPPITSHRGCPDHSMFTVCLKGKKVCGCSDAFGMLPKDPAVIPIYEDIGRSLMRQKEYELTIRLLTPVANVYSSRDRMLLYLADANWATGEKKRARGYYRAYRAIRLPIKARIPKRVFDRFREEKQ